MQYGSTKRDQGSPLPAYSHRNATSGSTRVGHPVAFLAAPAILILVALIAAYLPASRAAHISPAEALRGE